MATNLGLLLEQAHLARNHSQWAKAQGLYQAAVSAAPGSPQIHHNLALCLYARGQHGSAFEHAEIATRGAPQLVPAWVLRAKIERGLGDIEAAARSLYSALGVVPAEPHALLELAGLTMNELCDARETQRLVAPLLGHPDYDEDAQLTTLMAKLYDRDETAEEFSRQIVAFSRRYLRLPGFKFRVARKARSVGPKARKRVGLLSPLFCVSPVYFFTYGPLSLLAEEVDLVVFNRGTRSDWGTEKFRLIAREWHEVAHLPAEILANDIYAQNIDVLFDLGGWTDPVGLKALSTRPATRMYKWVGGQSCTTGLDVFDGFVSDPLQTPEDCRHLYTEPLLLLESGYVSYLPPDYMPPRVQPKKNAARIGVISNPLKLSVDFLRELSSRRNQLSTPGDRLCFVDRRYRHASVRERVLKHLFPLKRTEQSVSQIEFLAPESHVEFLRQIAQMSIVVDTFPYSGGLTTAEALHFGVPCLTSPGRIFSERHSFAHCGWVERRGRSRRKRETDGSVRVATGLMAAIGGGA